MILVFLCPVANMDTASRHLNVTVTMAGEEESVIFLPAWVVAMDTVQHQMIACALMAGLVEIAQHVCLQLDVYMDHAEIHHSHVNVKMDGKEPCVTCLFASQRV